MYRRLSGSSLISVTAVQCLGLRVGSNITLSSLRIPKVKVVPIPVKVSRELFQGNLPVEFSICNSVLIKYVTTHQYFYQIYNVGPELVSGLEVNIVERGRALVQSDVGSQPRQGRDDGKVIPTSNDPLPLSLTRFEMVYNEAFYKLGSGEVGISPHSWYHQCTSLNTLTGQQTQY